MNLIELLQKLKKEIRFEGHEKDTMRNRLLQFIEADKFVREADLTRRNTAQWLRTVSFLLKPLSMRVVAIIVILFLAGGGASFAAESALPGDILYPVKVHINENIVEALSITSEAKADWETTLAERRLEEAAKLTAKNHVSAETKAQLENDFEVHAERAKVKIHEIEVRGNITGAAGAASRFEGVLKVHEAVLGRIEMESKSEEKADEVRPLKAKVHLELEDIFGAREDLESKVSSHAEASVDARAEVKTAAEGKLGAAANVIASTRSFIESKKARLGIQATAAAVARLGVAENLITQGNTKLQAGNFGAAFNLGNQAIRVAQEARLLVKANADLNIKVRIGDEEEGGLNLSGDEAENELRASSTTEIEREQENDKEQSVSASSSVNVRTEDGGARSEGGLRLKVGL